MLRTLLVLALALHGACKDEPSTSAGPSSPAADPAEPADPGTDADDPTRHETHGPGLAGAVKEVIGRAEPSESTRLIPEGATILAGVDVAAFVSHPLFESLRGQLGRRQRQQLEAATACGVGPDKWRAFVIGVDPQTRDMAMVTEATGLGTRPTLECLVREIGTFTLSEDGKSMSDHTGGGIVLSDDAIAFATPAWMPRLRERVEGKGEAAVTGSLQAVFARTDPAAPLWFAGRVPERQRGMVRGMLGAEPTALVGRVRLSDAVGLRVTIEVPDPESAQQALQQQWNTLQALVIASGVPRAVADSVAIEPARGAVSVELRASPSDIERMLTSLSSR